MTERRAFMYVSQPNVGGAQLSTLGLADGLRPRWRLSFAVSYPGPFVEECARRGLPLEWIPMPEWYRFQAGRSTAFKLKWGLATLVAAARVFRKIGRDRPDLLYLFGRRDILLCALPAWFHSIPVVFHLRGLDAGRLSPANRLALAAARFLRASLVCNSENTLRLARRHGWKLPAEVVYNGIEFDESYDLPRATAREKFGAPEGAYVVGCASRISPGKNLDTLLRMTAALAPLLDRPLVLLLAGGEDIFQAGRMTAELKALAAELGIADRVRWLGHLREMGPFYRALDLFVSLTETESFGRMFVESMAAGTPTLATAVGGVPEIITDGVDGVFVPVHDPEAAARIAAELLLHPEKAAAIAAAGRQSARQRFSLESHVRRMEEIFGRAAEKKGETSCACW